MKHPWSKITLTAFAMLTIPSVACAMERGAADGRATASEARSGAPLVFVPGEVIVKMRPARTIEREVMSAMGVELDERKTSGGELVYRIPPAISRSLSAENVKERTLAVVEQFKARADVEYAQPNWVKRPADRTPRDPEFLKQWDLQPKIEVPGGIGMPAVWETNTGSRNVVVAVIDTGILPNHPDIVGSGNLIQGIDMISDPFIANDGNARDSDPTDTGDATAANECYPGSPPDTSSWHGTHVASTIGVGRTDNAVGIAGINWQVSVQAVRVLGKCGGTTSDINDAIRWAAGLPVPGVATNSRPAKVINLSLGTPPGVRCATDDPATQAAVQAAVAQGVVVVVAAGNDAVDASQVSPASCNGVITVAASDLRGNFVTRYSNFGPAVEIMAPGGDRAQDANGDGQPDGILGMVNGGYALYNGTSMAAPHVAGVAALLLAKSPGLTPEQVLAQLQAGADNTVQCPRGCGSGLLNASVAGEPPSNPPTPPTPPTPPNPPPPQSVVILVASAPPPPNAGQIRTPGEKNRYWFEAKSEKRYTIETQGRIDVVMSLFGPNDATRLITEDDDSGEGSNARITQALSPGRYEVEIRHYRANETGSYSVTVREERD